MSDVERFLAEHREVTRRFFLRAGAACAVAGSAPAFATDEKSPVLNEALLKLETFFTPAPQFRDVSRGKPVPHSLPDEKRTEVGLTRDTWKLEIINDPEKPAVLGKQFTKKDGNAIDFKELLATGEKHGVRFPKVMTCLNIGCPLGMGVWEGVPLREFIWRTQPKADLRRVFYYGYHNDDAKQMFRSSLPIGRVLEDPDDLPPVIVCYKLNGDWLDPKRGGPVRIVVPEAYGFKSIKWLTTIVLTNLAVANDTYIDGNNDVDSPLKTFAATLKFPSDLKANQPFAVTGWAQSGIAGLSKVQTWVQPKDKAWPADDPYFTRAPWQDAQILPVPKDWANLPENTVPKGTHGFDASGKPLTWPMRIAKAHWAMVHAGLPAGEYVFRCRTIDTKGHAQPMPRPFRKSGFCDIEAVKFSVS